MSFTDDYGQRKRKHEIQNLKREIELDMDYELTEEEQFQKVCEYSERIDRLEKRKESESRESEIND